MDSDSWMWMVFVECRSIGHKRNIANLFLVWYVWIFSEIRLFRKHIIKLNMNSCRTVNNAEFTIRNVLIIPSIIWCLCYEFHRTCQCVETYLQNFMSCWCDCCANHNEMSEKWYWLNISFSIKIIFLTLRAPAVWHIWWRFINGHLTLFNEIQAFNGFQMMINGFRDLAACNNFSIFSLPTTSIAILVLTNRQLSHALLHTWLYLQFVFLVDSVVVFYFTCLDVIIALYVSSSHVLNKMQQ